MSFALSSDPAAPPLPEETAVVANKQELADALKVSRPTLDALLRRYPDFPVIRRGSNGEAWQFDVAAVIAFLTARKAEEAAGTARRSELLAQVALPIDDVTPNLDPTLSPAERAKLADARLKERRLARESGLLVPTAEVRQALETAFTLLQTEFRSFLRQLGREHDWPDAVLRRHEAELADMLRRCHARAIHALADDGAPQDENGQLRLA